MVSAAFGSGRTGLRGAGAHAIAIAVLALMLLPQSVNEIAARIGYEMHVVSFIIGPAIYSFGDGLLPGVDYYSQYSVGLPYLFSWLLGANADAAIIHYVELTIASMLLFYLGLTYLLKWLFLSWRWALGTSITVLVLQFHTDRAFFDPSSYVLHYPLLVLTIAATAHWLRRGQTVASAILLAGALGASLFLNTETGLYQLVAASSIGLFASRGKLSLLARAGGVCVGALLAFGLLCAAAYGRGVLSAPFAAGLLQPFFLYGGGFGGLAIDWRWQWHLLYNIIAPGAALITIAWGSFSLWRGCANGDGIARTGALTMFGMLGILMSFKYANMSFVALWLVNSIGFIVVLAWWLRQAQLCYESDRLRFPGITIPGGAVVSWGGAFVALLLVSTAGDPRNPTSYALQSYLQYPSLLNAVLKNDMGGCRQLSCAAPLRVDRRDVELITRLVPDKQRAAVFGWYDWAYLIEARRASWFQFLPSHAIFTRPQLAAAAQTPEVFFLPDHDGADLGIKHPELAATLVPLLKRDYERIDKGYELAAWRRKR